MTSLLEGKRALVTGAGSGIGEATAVRFAAEGAQVAVVDLDLPAAERTARAIVADGGQAIAIRADVSSESDVAEAVAQVVARWQGLDVAVANAGVQLFGRDAAAHELTAETWRQTIDVNLTGAFFTCKHAIRAMLDGGSRGSVVLTGSPTGIIGIGAGFDAYSASKAGVWGLTRVLAREYASHGIRVNAVFPGFTATPLVQTILDDPAALEGLLHRVPLGRPGTPEEVAAMMAFVASSEAGYSTGAAFFTDGGLTAA